MRTPRIYSWEYVSKVVLFKYIKRSFKKTVFLNIYIKIVLIMDLTELRKMVRETLFGSKEGSGRDVMAKKGKWEDIREETRNLLDKLSVITTEKKVDAMSTKKLITDLEKKLIIWKDYMNSNTL